MNLILEGVKTLENTAPFIHWAEGREVVKTVAKHSTSHWLLPESACLAVGSAPDQALPAVAALIALHTSIIMVDDLLDGDRHFETLGLSQGDTANMAQGLAFSGLAVILNSPIPDSTKSLILSNLSHMMTATAIGQHLDTHSAKIDETTYWQIARAKSSPFFASAFYIGALTGGCEPPKAEKFLSLGCLYGEMIQIHDDLKDTLQTPASADWKENQISLPILFAKTVNHPEKEKFNILRPSVEQSETLMEAQKILLRCGAVSYCLQQLTQRYHQAVHILDEIELPDRRPLDLLFSGLVKPVHKLFENVGIPQAPEKM